ncbi:UMP-CMP kinase 2, mitochondrial [Pyxicephalus adspersus]|uniref:UMP-CMP kinase 2, mitochondrial n=1 Tax=Pyxicephalus adspersus TaxID=30357 RepID=UPI003B59B8E8
MAGCRSFHTVCFNLYTHISSASRSSRSMANVVESRIFAVESANNSPYDQPFYFSSKDKANLVSSGTSNVWSFLAQGGYAHSLCVTTSHRVQAARLHKSLGKKLTEILPGIPIVKLLSYIPGNLHGSLQRGFLILDPQRHPDLQNTLHSLLRENQQNIQLCTYTKEKSRVWQSQWEVNGQSKEMDRSEVVTVNGPKPSPFVEILRGSAVYSSLQDVLSVLKESSKVIPEAEKLLDFLDLSTFPKKGSNPVIVIEGLDATGKTTLTESLKQHLNAALLRSPPDSISQWRKIFDEETSLIKRAYYALSNYVAAVDIAKASEVSPVIVDRFWHSTAAYAIATEIGGGIQNLPDHHHIIYHWPDDLLKPDLILFLTVSDEERIRRIRNRGLEETQEEKELEANNLFRQKVEEAYRRMENPGCVVIDAGDSREAVLNKALSIIKRHCSI